jgi:hypothetical protein
MKQKNQCLGILICLGLFTGLRAFWTTISLVLGLDAIPDATAVYNLLVAAGVWVAVGLLRQVPVQSDITQKR